VALHRVKGKETFLKELYARTKQELQKPKEEQANMVQEIYNPFTPEQISDKIAELIRPNDLKADFQLIYQTIEGLHTACPKNLGDWYFTGNYPTPGGNKVSNQAFVNYMEGNNRRAY